jgi:hypothetical protein
MQQNKLLSWIYKKTNGHVLKNTVEENTTVGKDENIGDV